MRHTATTEDILDVVGEIYDCAIHPQQWQSALERVARLVDGKSVAVTLNSIDKPDVEIRAKWNIDAEFEAAMLANYGINPLVPMIWYLGECEVFSVLSAIEEAELKRTKFYENTIGRYGVVDSLVGILAKSRSQFGSISIQRAGRQLPFAAADIELLTLLVPHIRRAVMIAELLDARALERDQLRSTLDLLTVGVVLTDGNGRVAHANKAAHIQLDAHCSIRREHGAIAACHPGAAADLRTSIANAAAGTTVSSSHAGNAVILKSTGGQDLAAWVLPLDGGLRRDLGWPGGASVAVFLKGLTDTSPVPAELFVRHYRITPAECRVLILIVQGMTVQQSAETLGISIGTARTHLKSLFQKTGTERQADLVRMAMSALAPASR